MRLVVIAIFCVFIAIFMASVTVMSKNDRIFNEKLDKQMLEENESTSFDGKFGDCYSGKIPPVLLDEKTVHLPKIIARQGTLYEFLTQDEADLTLRLWVCIVEPYYLSKGRKEYRLETRYTPAHPGHSVSLFYEAQLVQGPITYVNGSSWKPPFDGRTTPYYQYIDSCIVEGGENDCRGGAAGGVNLSNPFTIKFVCNEIARHGDEQNTAYGSPRPPVCTAGPEISVNMGGTPPDNTGNPYTGIACTATGAWFDPEQNGSGFNLINTPSGYVMYFYGYKGGVNGEPLWLLSEVGPTHLSVGKSFELTMYSGFVGNDSSFSTKPTGDRSGLKKWGTAKISFTSDATGVITLSGKDGTITHNIQRLTAVQGLDCSGVAPMENRFSLTGAWYDKAYAGSGFNIIDTTSDFAMYVYGYKGSANGKTLWLLSDVGDKNIIKGKTYTLPVYSGYSGNFTQKPTAGNSGIKKWGKATFTFNSCNQGVITLAGNDGTITHNVQRLITVNGLQCSE